MSQQKMVAMILAGGRGSRLFDLTKKVAKPAVHFGGKYRIIDFCLSNCTNSGIDTVGILTQYESVLLNYYVGHPNWGFDGRSGGLYVLPPRETVEGFSVYRGTADAITQNIDFIDESKAEYVLILSGDHIYKMDYDRMLQFHKQNQADATIAVLDVPLEEASRFGIMNADENNRIYEFEEKPAHPKSTLASMGIYIFTWKALREKLLEDQIKEDSNHDFGKDIIPAYLREEKRLYAYPFEGYWKDVGTIESLWEANMDLIDNRNAIDLSDKNWRIYTEDEPDLPAFVSQKASIENCLINQGSHISGNLSHSVIFNRVRIRESAEVKDSVIMPDVLIEEGSKVTRAMVNEGVTIGKNAVVGKPGSEKVTLVARDIKEGEVYYE